MTSRASIVLRRTACGGINFSFKFSVRLLFLKFYFSFLFLIWCLLYFKPFKIQCFNLNNEDSCKRFVSLHILLLIISIANSW